MGIEKTYNYFLAALDDWVAEKKKAKEAPQKLLAIDLSVEESTISRYLKKRSIEKPIPFQSQLEIAMACGYDYIDFLQRGAGIMGHTPKPKAPNSPDEILLDKLIAMLNSDNEDIVSAALTVLDHLGVDLDSKNIEIKKPIPMDPAVQLLQECIEEAGRDLNPKQREAIVEIIRNRQGQIKNEIDGVLKAFG